MIDFKTSEWASWLPRAEMVTSVSLLISAIPIGIPLATSKVVFLIIHVGRLDNRVSDVSLLLLLLLGDAVNVLKTFRVNVDADARKGSS
jgi:hypothetical protein